MTARIIAMVWPDRDGYESGVFPPGTVIRDMLFHPDATEGRTTADLVQMAGTMIGMTLADIEFHDLSGSLEQLVKVIENKDAMRQAAHTMALKRAGL